ncbi:hypothetical protein M427DRAFT_131621 [Gonapodya prolifera JEL478]|uniref:ZZ-type domain-containing protein n=1 Tax=Gonapodya prolifera (strain JEL478) TaxID=1344416 RepID=A0A139AUT3_GONPJ|nr:hypothetical protein M427DRAFT_131621 [Gonapodya prolifera JEL478]|eukprot:KXS20255.1 hypothetical protein M427DRAFT_131621 [Gonapodya prolifera JEL478]
MEAEAEKAPRHVGVTCSHCESVDFEGVRWKCLECPAYDLCGTCERFSSLLHPTTHSFLKLARPGPVPNLGVFLPQATPSDPPPLSHDDSDDGVDFVALPDTASIQRMPTKRELFRLLEEEERKRFSPRIQALYLEAESDPGKGRDWLTVTEQMQADLVREFGFGVGAVQLLRRAAIMYKDDPAFQNVSVYVRENRARAGNLRTGDLAPDVPLLTLELVETSTGTVFGTGQRPVVVVAGSYT